MATTTRIFVIAVILVVTIFAGLSWGHNSKHYEMYRQEQQVDHFSYVNNDTFQQRYMINRDHWCINCPILLFIGHEFDIILLAENYEGVLELAQRLKAAVIMAEHRYYGRSVPYENVQSKRRFDYLTIDQVLADSANLVADFKQNYRSPGSPVIAVGGDYGGTLAAWMRMKYPHLIEGALASSALSFTFDSDQCGDEFFKIVTQNYRDYGESCSDSIARSWPIIDRLLSSPTGRSELMQLFRICDANVNNFEENFVDWLRSAWATMATLDYTSPSTIVGPLPAYPVHKACSYLQNGDVSDKKLMENIAAAANVYTNWTGQLECLNLPNLHADNSPQFFQSCTQKIITACSDGTDVMFPAHEFNLEDHADSCFKTWNVRPDVSYISTNFGTQMDSHSNIIFSWGSSSPLSYACQKTSLEENSIIALEIPGAVLYEDLRKSDPNDSYELRQARQEELSIIRSWITKYYGRKLLDIASGFFQGVDDSINELVGEIEGTDMDTNLTARPTWNITSAVDDKKKKQRSQQIGESKGLNNMLRRPVSMYR